ncbi:MAG: phosphohexose mutase [Betaproteobacteria bacterium]|nr:phosphohexose mutase [Betaproteobacteria bacterium]
MTAAIVLAGGLGTRLRGEVPDLPKPMAPVAGRPFLEYLLDYWIAQGISRFVLSVGYRHEAISGHFGNSYSGVPIDYAIEKLPLGTGGGLVLAAQKLDSAAPFVVLNGDSYFAVDLEALAAFAQANRADWCFSLFRANEVGRYMSMGVDADGRITSLTSGTGAPRWLANGGVYWMGARGPGQFTAGSKLSIEDDIFPAAMAAGRRLYGLEFTGTFIDIGVPADYRRAASLLAV